MAEENNASFPQADDGGAGRVGDSGAGRGGDGGAGRGGRGGGNREAGGFRIRLSDNELRAVRAIQEAFNLRSTVAALGFSVRTLAQMLEDGKLDALVAEQRAQAGSRPERSGGGRRGEGRGEGRSERGGGGGGGRANPFARPQKPAPVATVEAIEAVEATEAASDESSDVTEVVADPAIEAGASEQAEASTEA